LALAILEIPYQDNFTPKNAILSPKSAPFFECCLIKSNTYLGPTPDPLTQFKGVPLFYYIFFFDKNALQYYNALDILGRKRS
jgi:hypothetical protein